MERKTIFTAVLLCVTLFVPLALFGQEFEMNGTVLVKYNGNAANVTIPEGVTAIGDRAFQFKRSLTSVTIPLGVTSIGDNAFSECTSLTSIIIPASVTSIEVAAFRYNQLTRISIGSNVTLEIAFFIEDEVYPLNKGFVEFYISNGRLVGTYTNNNGTWRRE